MKSVEQGAVFEELRDGRICSGYVVLTIRASMKTPKEGYYLFASKDSLQGKPQYPFIFNIGGQGVTWQAIGVPDTQPRDIDGKRNPEGGEGVKYTLEKKIRIKPGSYRVYVGLTDERLQKEVDVLLSGESVRILEFKPVYRRDRGWGPRFYRGLNDFEVFLDGRKIDQSITH